MSKQKGTKVASKRKLAPADSKEDQESEPVTKHTTYKKKIFIEHCKSCHVFKRRAVEIEESLKAVWPVLEFSYNETKPRRGAFELSLSSHDSSDPVLVWSGVKKGPPRKNKFPSPETVIELLKPHMEA